MFKAERLEKDGWPLLDVETEVNRDSKSTHEKCPGWFVWLVVGSLCRYKIILSYHGCSPSLSKLRQAVVPGRLSLNMCLCVEVTFETPIL
jgi:hypothetical protein